MISRLAIDDIEEMQAQGLTPTPADIVRLNAMGLKLEAARKRHSTTALDYLPRIAALNGKVTFRQPTIGHEIWIAKAEQLADRDDWETLVAIKAYALSRSVDDLAPIENRDAFVKAVEDFTISVKDLTRSQIIAALDYVYFGSSPLVGENSPSTPRDESESEDDDDSAQEESEAEAEDWKSCIALGILHEGQVALWGVTRADLEKMTRQQAEEMIRRAYLFHGFAVDGEIKRREGDYYATKNEIISRLKAKGEGENGNE